MKAKDIMTHDPITIGPKTNIREIAEILTTHNISGLPVVGEDGAVLGIVSEGDLMRKEIAPKTPDVLSILGAIIYYNGLKEYQQAFRKMSATTAEEIMTDRVVTVQQHEEVSQVRADHARSWHQACAGACGQSARWNHQPVGYREDAPAGVIQRIKKPLPFGSGFFRLQYD